MVKWLPWRQGTQLAVLGVLQQQVVAGSHHTHMTEARFTLQERLGPTGLQSQNQLEILPTPETMALPIRQAHEGRGKGKAMHMGAQTLLPTEQVQGLGKAVAAVCSSHTPWRPRGLTGPEPWKNIQAGPGIAMGRDGLGLEAP